MLNQNDMIFINNELDFFTFCLINIRMVMILYLMMNELETIDHFWNLTVSWLWN